METTKEKMEKVYESLKNIQEILNTVSPDQIEMTFDFYRLTNNVFIARSHTEQILQHPIKN